MPKFIATIFVGLALAATAAIPAQAADNDIRYRVDIRSSVRW